MLTLELSKWLPVPAGTWKDIKASPSVFYICLARFVLLGQVFFNYFRYGLISATLKSRCVFRGLDVFCLEFWESDLRSVTWQRRFYCYSRSWVSWFNVVWRAFFYFQIRCSISLLLPCLSRFLSAVLKHRSHCVVHLQILAFHIVIYFRVTFA
jgi:hypothetical protein